MHYAAGAPVQGEDEMAGFSIEPLRNRDESAAMIKSAGGAVEPVNFQRQRGISLLRQRHQRSPHPGVLLGGHHEQHPTTLSRNTLIKPARTDSRSATQVRAAGR